MNPLLQQILDSLQEVESLSEEKKTELTKTLKAVDKELTILDFKLDRTEKVKRTTAILLEETIDELEQKRKAVEESKLALENSLTELKAAQAQLIQSEKMASLGELTAGIAHEIQNPLNFVNNFSELSAELVGELQEGIEKGDMEEVKFIAHDLKENLNKINHHGKRAGSIIRGMLEHSRKSEGKKEPVDVNSLADECLKLGFHGLRAKDKSFTANFKATLGSEVSPIMVVRQEIGRVLLNLINNAFYAVNEKAKNSASSFMPHVEVSTRQIHAEDGKEGYLEITISDNGLGIPEAIKDKIFQPFFTTKPTGSGTGLGLSLSYDIVKAHGGELIVESSLNEYTVFSIFLPLTQ